jgi:ABC-2 type transport system permease protein
MKKIWLVARHQFMKEASKRSFILVLLALPLFLLLSVGLGFLFAQFENETATLGYVDQAGIMKISLPESEDADFQLASFETRESAASALDEGQIDGFYVIAEDYRSSHAAELVFYEQPPYQTHRLFEDALRINLLANQPEAVVDRILNGARVTIRATEVNREFEGGDPSFGLFLPLIVAAIFGFLVLTTSGYLTEVIVDEKENRTMEIVVTSLSTGRMMAGKILGAVGIAAIQLSTWVFFIIAIIWLGGKVLEVSWLQSVNPGWADLLKVVVVALPTYLCIAALMTIIGSSLIDSQEASQAAMLSMIFMFLPIYAFVLIASNPNGPIALVLTFIPMTSITTVALRSLFMEIPTWQIGLSASIAFVTAIVLIWLAGRTFRVSMLRYGQRMKLTEIFGRTNRVAKPTPSQ